MSRKRNLKNQEKMDGGWDIAQRETTVEVTRQCVLATGPAQHREHMCG